MAFMHLFMLQLFLNGFLGLQLFVEADTATNIVSVSRTFS